jgi:signal transduction histidine kinase
MTAGRVGGLAARVRSAARRPVLWGASCGGDVALAAAVTIVAVVFAVKGYLYVAQVTHLSRLPGGVTYVVPARNPQPVSLPIRSMALVGVVLTTAPLAFRRTYPTSAFGVMLVAFLATKSYSTGITVAAVIFAGYCAVAYSRYRRATLLGLLAAAIVITVVYPEATGQVPERYTPLLVLLPTVALGYMMRMWRQRARDSAERLRLAQAAHEAETRRAIETERARIASELHDVVTHNVSVMVVQAGAARRVLDSSPDDAHEALLAIEASGRTAMTELRHLLGLLAPAEPAAPSGEPGTGGAAGQPGAVGIDDAVLRPQPSLGNVPALVERVRVAGMPVELSVTGTPRDVPQGLDLAGYRVVQEALTNVIKHADRARTTIRIEYRAHDLRIDVANEAPATPGTGLGGGSGRGVIGLRERIAIYGGALDAGPRPGGGWRVRATIPLEPAGAGGNAAAPAYVHGASA